MSGFCRSFAENRGVHIEGHEKAIDLTVLKILGEGEHRHVELGVYRCAGVTEPHILHHNEELEVAQGVKIRFMITRPKGRRAYFSCTVANDDRYTFI